jgi:hypothetical protein
MAGFRVIEWYCSARLNASTLRLTPSRAAYESHCLCRADFLTLAQLRDDAELLRHAQRVQVDPLFVDSPLDQQVGSALTVS